MTITTYGSNGTVQRFAQLQIYYDEVKINPGPEFKCKPNGLCREIVDLKPGYVCHRGGLAYVGEQYDVAVDSDELRILFVGKDGGNSEFDLNQRRADIQNYRGSPNPHYSGIVKVLMEVFQERFDGAQSEWRTLLKRMAQTNATRCAISKENGSKKGGMGCNTTNRMRNQCWTHFRTEIDILKPTVMFFHGKDLGPWFLKQAANDGTLSELEGGSERLRAHCKQITWTTLPSNFETILLFFNHPGHGHFGKQWESVAIPVIQELRRIGKLPTFNRNWLPLGRREWPAI